MVRTGRIDLVDSGRCAEDSECNLVLTKGQSLIYSLIDSYRNSSKLATCQLIRNES